MKNEKNLTPDELFRQHLDSFEAPFEDAAWEHMQAMLDKEEHRKPVVLLPISNSSTKKKITITMILITVASAIAWLATDADDKSNIAHTSSHIATQKGKGIESQQSEKLTTAEKKDKAAYYGNTDGVVNPTVSGTGNSVTAGSISRYLSAVPDANPGIGKTEPDFEAANGKAPIAAARQGFQGLSRGLSLYQTPALTNNPDFGLKSPLPSTRYPGGGYFDGGFIGVHFTRQYSLSEELQQMDSTRQPAGFNVQFMGRNLSKSPYFGANFGFDFGMQFYGRGKNNGVVLNNTTQDSGFTRLHSMSFDFLLRGHLEFGPGRIKPYLNVFAGPRLYSTGQYVASYLQLKNTESSASHNAATNVSLMYGAAAGVRMRLGKVVSLDVRGEYMTGTPVSLVDMNRSSFNGLSYDLYRRKLTPEYAQLKLGLLFDLSESDEDRREENNNQSNEQTSYRQPAYYYYYDAEKGRNVPLCPCNCDSTRKEVPDSLIKSMPESKDYDPLNVQPGRKAGQAYEGNSKIILIPGSGIPTSPGSGRTRSSSGSGIRTGGGKSSFPGIKSGGSGGIRIKS
ncbi:MAG: hypothetical protein JNL57_08330 [Bacteroidetes bacterium]|nr:hypothetical protein [Bacteroidota bacterium]